MTDIEIKDALEKAAGFDEVVALLKRMQTG